MSKELHEPKATRTKEVECTSAFRPYMELQVCAMHQRIAASWIRWIHRCEAEERSALLTAGIRVFDTNTCVPRIAVLSIEEALPSCLSSDFELRLFSKHGPSDSEPKFLTFST